MRSHLVDTRTISHRRDKPPLRMQHPPSGIVNFSPANRVEDDVEGGRSERTIHERERILESDVGGAQSLQFFREIRVGVEWCLSDDPEVSSGAEIFC